MNVKARVQMVRAMDLIARSVNDEMVLMTWLSVGVADGDYKLSDEELETYVEDDDDFRELMSLFRRIIGRSEIYCDHITSE